MRSTPVLSSTKHLKVVVYFKEDLFVPFSGICPAMKLSYYKHFGYYLVANHLIKNTTL